MRKEIMVGVAGAVILAGCSQSRAEDGGPTVQRSYQVGPFDRIELGGSYDVEVRTGSKLSVSATGPEKMLDNLVVEVDGDKLLIHPRDHRFFNFGFRSGRGVRMEVSLPSLRGAAIAGSGNIKVDKVQADSFDGWIGGSGDLQLGSVNVRILKLSVGGSGDVAVRSGKAKAASFDIAGSGDIDASAVTAKTATASVAGSGDIRGQATGTASVSIAGSGDVMMTGGAKCSASKMGSGDAHCS